MMLGVLAMAALLVAAGQLLLCFCVKSLWIKLAPLILFIGADAVCWGIYAGGVFSQIYGADFAVYIYGILLAAFSAVDVVCWGIYGVVWFGRKRMRADDIRRVSRTQDDSVSDCCDFQQNRRK